MFGLFRIPKPDGDNAPDPRELLRIHNEMRSGNKNKLYVYHKPNVMVDHNYTDDVAITWAYSKDDALKKFKKDYDCDIGDIDEVWFNSDGIAILTDY